MSRRNAVNVVLAAVVFTGLSWGGQARASLIDNMEGHWQFDDSANRGNDSTANDRDLTVVGNPSFPQGLFGQALDLTKDNTKYVVRPTDDAAFDFGGGNFTIQIWANFHDTSGEQTIIEKFTGDSGPGWTLTKPGDSFQFFAPNLAVVSGPAGVTAGVWHQLVLRRDGTVLEMLVDGNAVFSVVLGPGAVAVDVNAPLLIGRRNAGDSRDFSMNAKIDEVAIWSRAVTDAELDTLFLLGKAAAAIPEPTSIFLLVAGATALLRRRRRRA